MLNEKIKENVFLVNNISIVNDNIKLIFSTLWSKISPVNEWYIRKGMSDFQVIKYKCGPFDPEHFNQLHVECLSFIKQELTGNKTNNTVIVTHHVPTFMNYPSKYKGDILNEAFAVELFDFIELSGPDYWIYGHNHSNTRNFEIGETSLRTNQLGYVKYGENLLFTGNEIIEI